MKTQKKVLKFFILLFFIIPSLYSQNSSDISKLITGKTYRVILFDETEITGKILSIDSNNVTLEAANKNTIIIPRANILYYSTGLNPSVYTASISLLGGISLFSDAGYSYSSGGGNSLGPNINTALILFFSDTKAAKIDVGFTYVKPGNDQYIYPAIYPQYQSTYTGGNLSMYSLKFSLLYGNFCPDQKFMFYGSLGIGIHLTHQSDITSSYWYQSYPDTSNWIHTINTMSYPLQANLIGSLGGSVGYRFSKSFGIRAEVEYNLVTSSNGYTFFGGRSYFPMRAGVFYVF